MKKKAGVLLYCYKKRKLHVLLVFNGKNWSIPKGDIETGESKKGTALRELFEECNIEFTESIKSLASVSKDKSTTLYCYFAHCTQRPVPDDGIQRAAYLSYEKACQVIQEYQLPLLEQLKVAVGKKKSFAS